MNSILSSGPGIHCRLRAMAFFWRRVHRGGASPGPSDCSHDFTGKLVRNNRDSHPNGGFTLAEPPLGASTVRHGRMGLKSCDAKSRKSALSSVLVSLALLTSSSAVTLLSQEPAAESERLRQSVARLYEQGKYEQALPVAEKARQIVLDTLGKESPSYATSLNDLATLYNYLGRYEEAEPLHRQALDIIEECSGRTTLPTL